MPIPVVSTSTCLSMVIFMLYNVLTGISLKKKFKDPKLVPHGWTTDTWEVGLSIPWETVPFEGPYIAETFGLENPQFVMTTKPETGEHDVMFQSNERIYIRNQVADQVFEITNPKDLTSILKIMSQKDKGMKALKYKEVPCVE